MKRFNGFLASVGFAFGLCGVTLAADYDWAPVAQALGRSGAQLPGGVYRVDIDGRNVAHGEYLEIVPYSRVVFTWGWEGDDSPLPPGSSTVEITLVADGDGTIVRLRHLGLPAEAQASHAEGWDHFLPRLVVAAEGRASGPDQTTPSQQHT